MHAGLTVPESLGQLASWRLEPNAPPTRIWVSVGRKIISTPFLNLSKAELQQNTRGREATSFNRRQYDALTEEDLEMKVPQSK